MAAGAGKVACLAGLPRGTSAAERPYNHLGIQLSRGFEALTIWMSLTADGRGRPAHAIARTVEQARHRRGGHGTTGMTRGRRWARPGRAITHVDLA